MNSWLKKDPRYSIDKFAVIIIIRPTASGRDIGFGWVYTDTDFDGNQMWSVHTTFEDHRRISADDEWDVDWQWTFAPDR